MSFLASVKNSFRHRWPKGSPNQEAKDNWKLELCEGEKKQIPAVFAEIIKAGVHQTAHLDCILPGKGQ